VVHQDPGEEKISLQIFDFQEVRLALPYPIALEYLPGLPDPAILGNMKRTAALCCSADLEDIASSAKTCWKPYSYANRAVLSTPISVEIRKDNRVHPPPPQLESRSVP